MILYCCPIIHISNTDCYKSRYLYTDKRLSTCWIVSSTPMKNHDIPGIINGKKNMNNQQTPIPDSHLEAIHLWISSAWSPTASSTVARWRSRDIGSRAPRKTPWWPAAPRTWEVKAWVKRTGWSMKNGDLMEFTEIYRDLRWFKMMLFHQLSILFGCSWDYEWV